MSKFSVKSVVSVVVASFIAFTSIAGIANAADLSGWQSEVKQTIAKKKHIRVPLFVKK